MHTDSRNRLKVCISVLPKRGLKRPLPIVAPSLISYCPPGPQSVFGSDNYIKRSLISFANLPGYQRQSHSAKRALRRSATLASLSFPSTLIAMLSAVTAPLLERFGATDIEATQVSGASLCCNVSPGAAARQQPRDSSRHMHGEPKSRVPIEIQFTNLFFVPGVFPKAWCKGQAKKSTLHFQYMSINM